MRILVLLLALTAAVSAHAQSLSGPWRVTAMAGAALPADAEATLEMTSDRITGRAFCNRFTAALEREGPEIAISQAATTRMACPPALMALERTFIDILGAANSATVAADGVLTIRAPDGRTIVARRM
jgi:putative lipoprotein